MSAFDPRQTATYWAQRCDALEHELAAARERIAELEGVDGGRWRTLGLSPARANCLEAIVRCNGRIAKRDMLALKHPQAQDTKIVDVTVCLLRAALRPYIQGEAIRTHWGLGYSATPALLEFAASLTDGAPVPAGVAR